MHEYLLAAFRKPFVPPSLSQEPIILRSLSYGGENHPATKKAVLVAPVSRLGLENPQAIRKFKLLAGVRWSPDAPLDAGLSPQEVSTLRQRKILESGHDGHGFFKISHEGFPELQMNLKWCSDTLENLISEAKVGPFFYSLCYIVLIRLSGFSEPP
jgi:small subunit ribosomal protein S35